MILLKNKDKKANIKIGNNIEIKDGSDFPFDLTLYGRSTQETSTNPVSPSPDFPSPIESVGRKNLFDVNSITENTYLIAGSGETGSSSVSNVSDYIFVKANQSYYLSYSYTSLVNTSYRALCYYDTNKNFINGITIDPTSFHTFTPAQDGYIRFSYDKNYTNIQLEKGSVATDYVPYEHTEISAEVTGKNLFDLESFMSSRGVIYTKNSDGSFLVNTGGSSHSNPYQFSETDIDVSLSGLITLGTATYARIQLLNNNNDVISEITSSRPTILNKKACKICFNWTKQGTFTLKDVMLEKGTVATDYEEYKSNSLAIDLQGNELCSLPNGTKDEVNIVNGEALLNKKIKKAVFDGSDDEAWSMETDTHRFSIALYDGINKNQRYPIISNYFKYSADTNNIGVGFVYGNRLYLYPDTSITTADEFKTWLSTHNVEVLYELAEPETINLGTVEMPHTYDGISNITNSADTEMTVKYYKNFEFDKILRSGYNIDEQEYEIAKKQMANGKRKKILSSYIDCIIKIDLGLLDNKTYQEYKKQLEDGEYEYWSYKYNQYKKANFILTKPSITTEYAYDDDIGIDDIEITLEKSSDVS